MAQLRRCTHTEERSAEPVRMTFLAPTRSQLGRWVGVAAGAIGAISAVWWMPYYPIWSLTYVGLGVAVIYALSAYGGRESGTAAEHVQWSGPLSHSPQPD